MCDLSREERIAEEIHNLVSLGQMGKDEYCRRMGELEAMGPNGKVGACYAEFLLLSQVKDCPERQQHAEHMRQRLSAALAEIRFSQSV